MADQTLDVRGLQCPLPILKAHRALQHMEPGAKLKVLATDPGAQDDFDAFCLSKGHLMLEATTSEDWFCFVIQRKM